MGIKFFLAVYMVLSFQTLATKAQSLNFKPQKVEISDTVLINLIAKYGKSIDKHEVIIVSHESHLDSVKYYISTMRSSYKLYKNIPTSFAKIGKYSILIYTGLEHIIKIYDIDRKQFVAIFSDILDKDLLPNGMRDEKEISLYDPMEILVIIKNGKMVSENFKKGFGARGMPYMNK